MVRPKHLLRENQRLLEERLSLYVLALVLVEQCQLVEKSNDIGVVRFRHLPSDHQCKLHERLGLSILPKLGQIPCSALEQGSCLHEGEVVLFNEKCTSQSVG